MVIVKRIALKPVNVGRLRQELAVLPLEGVRPAGFDRVSARQQDPIPGDQRNYERLPDGTIDVALKGELRFQFARPLTRAEDAALDDAVVAHSHLTLSDDQTRQDQDKADLDTVRAAFDGGAAFDLDVRRAVLRLLLRDQRGEPI